MSSLAWVLLGVATAAAVTDWVAVARGNRRLEYLAKPLTMAALVAVALTLDPADPGRRVWFVAAGTLSLAGDVFLMLPRDRFVAGLTAFLLAHVCYVAGLLRGEVSAVGAFLGVAVVIGAVLTVGRVVLQSTRHHHPELFAPVIAYVVVISAMVVTATATGPAMAIGGALLFYASDGVLAIQRLVKPMRGAPVVVMVTYHLGQAGLLLSLVQP
jgi:uncharacterized membrane protein YhhN